ncbi:hypothetical protein BJX68DRAFT_265259 [Aspergillus pseudodeflectus]|uniref:Myb-like DNA-binding domain-containing protein n=1 Tax=Aspergillus pseudodeflectus TaxID=176178 RepID=A0ABR4KL74_9EURO
MSTEKPPTSTPTVVRRSKTMPIDSPTAKFLYTILKQLDLKGIDWSLVASQLEISNGHAARMRYHRFKNQMEGTTSTPRKRAANKTSKTITGSSSKGCFQKEISPQPLQMIKTERPPSPCEMKPYMKIETDQYPQHVPNLADIPQHVPSPRIMPMSMQAVSRACGSPLPAPMPYRRMELVPKLAMYGPSSMPMSMHAPMAMGYTQGRCSPVAWTPVKIEEEDNIFGKQGMDVDTVKEEIVHEPIKPVE